MRKRGIAVISAAAIVLLAGAATFGLTAQQPPAVKRTILMKQEMTIPGREAVMAFVDIPVGAAEGYHTHPAEVFIFVLEGTIKQELQGKPDEVLKAGDHFYVAPGQVHQATNIDKTPVKLAAVFVAEKGKPLTTPVK